MENLSIYDVLVGCFVFKGDHPGEVDPSYFDNMTEERSKRKLVGFFPLRGEYFFGEFPGCVVQKFQFLVIRCAHGEPPVIVVIKRIDDFYI